MRNKGLKNFLLILFMMTLSSTACSVIKKVETLKEGPYKLLTVYDSDDVVWSFAFISTNELLITHRSGGLYYFNIKTKEKIKLKGPSVTAAGQGGLLDVHYHPHSGKNYVYVTFSERVGDLITTSLARGVYSNKKVLELETLFQAQVKSDTTRHFGSRLLFQGEYIYMSIGDRGERKFAQDLSLHNGKILRLNLNGKAAKGNPFVKNKKALPEIWSYGHRNPQGLDVNPINNLIYSSEFGPRGGDELNLILKGANYGWPVITYGKEYWGPSIGTTQKKGMQQPVAHWVPSISPSGMSFYSGDKTPEWRGHLFLANLSSTHLRRLVLKNKKVVEQEVLFKALNERIRHVRTSRDGYLYFSTDSGKIIKVLKK